MLKKEKTITKVNSKTNPEFDNSEIGQVFNLGFYLRQKPIEPISATILKTLFDSVNYNQVAIEIFSNVKNSKAVCAKIFEKGDIAFKCLDCEKDPTCVICKECYEKGNHKGHRVVVQKYVSGCCDCGDPDAWAQAGFCSDHPGYENFKPTCSIDDIPEEFKQRFIQIFEKSLYYLFNLYEEHAMTMKDSTYFLEAIDQVLLSILHALNYCGEKSMALYALLCKLLRTKLSDNNRQLHVKTTDLKQMMFSLAPKLCDFTYFECLIYFHQLNSSSPQKKLEEFCIKLFLDYDFKMYIAETYIKMICFVFPPSKSIESPTNETKAYTYTKLTGLSVQLFTAEEFAIIGMNSPYFTAFLDNFGSILKSMINMPNIESFYTIIYYSEFFSFSTQKKSSRIKLLYQEDFLTKAFEWMNDLNYAFKIDVTQKTVLDPYKIETNALLIEVESKILQTIDHVFIELSLEEDIAKKTQFVELIAGKFVNIIKQNDVRSFQDRAEFDKYRSYHIPLYRAFGIFVKNLLEEPTLESLDDLLRRQMNISDRNLEMVVAYIFKMALRTLTFPIDNEKKGWKYYSQVYDLFSSTYRNPKLKFFDYDVLLLQLGMLFGHKEDICFVLETSVSVNVTFRNLFKSISSGSLEVGKFTTAVEKIQEKMEFIEDASPPLKQTKRNNRPGKDEKVYKIDVLIDEFFNTIIMLCIDEMSLVNLFYQKTKMFEVQKHPEFCKEVYKDLLTNLFQKQTKMGLKTIKEKLLERVTHDKSDLENSIDQVATFNTSTKSFQLKDKLINTYEPFIFVRDPQLLVETQESIKNRLKADKVEPDFVVGNNSFVYEYKHSLPTKIQEKVFELPLIEFATLCLVHSEEVTKRSSLLVKPILKLLHMALNFAVHFKKEPLMRRLVDLLGNQEMNEVFKVIKSSSELVEAHSGVERILCLIGEIQLLLSLEREEQAIDIEKPEESTDKKSRESIEKRMLEIKKQFSQKRDSFLKRTSYVLQEDDLSEESLICYVCNSAITPETEYGIPAFFAESSLYNLAFEKSKVNQISPLVLKELGQDLTSFQSLDKEAFRSYPVVTTCSHNFHYIHKDCFEKTSRVRNTNSSFVYGNDLEYGCSLCKSLCNILVPEPNKKTESEETKEEPINIEIAGIKDLMEHIKTLKPIAYDSTSKPSTLFNDVMFLEIINKGNDKKLSIDISSEDHILTTFDKLLGQSCHTITFGGLEYFMKHKYNLYKALREAYKNFYKCHFSSSKATYYENKKNLLLRYIQTLLGNLPEPFESKDDELLFRDSLELKSALTTTPDEFIFEVMQHLVISSDHMKNLEMSLISRIMKLYLVHKIVQVYLKKKLLREGLKGVTFEDFMNDLSLGTNSPIKEELINGLLPTMRKIVVFVLLNRDINKEVISALAKGSYLSDEEELNSYLRIEGLGTTASELLSHSLFEYSGIPQESVEIWLNSVHNEFKLGIESLNPYLLMVDQEVIFSFVELPENYYDLSTTYIEKKCEICNDHPQAGNRCICLMCGIVLCSIKCTKSDTRPKVGNLNKHSDRYHAGECVFLNVETGRIYLVKTPKNVDHSHLYTDRFGYGLEQKKNWKDFKIDKGYLDTLKEKLLYEKVAQEISYNIINNNKKLYDSLL